MFFKLHENRRHDIIWVEHSVYEKAFGAYTGNGLGKGIS